MNSIKKNTMTELRRDELLQRLIDQGIYKVDGRQLFELSFYELLKLYTASQETA
ncbi:Fur-regulated basic protein FbpA [Chryseomicrobium palamuruense]